MDMLNNEYIPESIKRKYFGQIPHIFHMKTSLFYIHKLIWFNDKAFVIHLLFPKNWFSGDINNDVSQGHLCWKPTVHCHH